MVPTPRTPEIFQTPIDEIDLTGLPAKSDPGFIDSLTSRYTLEYGARGWSATVVVSDGYLRVVAVPEEKTQPKTYLVALLNHGRFEDALPALQSLYGMVNDPDICFNYGVALAALDKVEESLAPLRACLKLDPSYDRAAIALSISCSKLEQYHEAESILRKAAKIQPDNALIKQNLAEILARAGRSVEALPFFRQAASLAPNNPACLMGLAQCLNSIAEHQAEALKVCKDLVKKFPDSPFTEAAKQILERAGKDYEIAKAMVGK